MNQLREALAGIGVSTAALTFGGSKGGPGPAAETELWNGTNWTEVADLNQARSQMPQGSGTSTNGLGYGGQTPASPGFLTNNEIWSGTTPSTVTFTDS
jgi:hypothetical protein